MLRSPDGMLDLDWACRDHRLLDRLHTPALRATYLAWRAARTAEETLPRLGNLDLGAPDIAESQLLLGVEQIDGAEPSFRVIAIGSLLTRRLQSSVEGTLLTSTGAAGDALGTSLGAYRRCLRTAAPVFESAKFDFGDGRPIHFERLLVPISRNGKTVTHIAGVVLYRGTPSVAPPEPHQNSITHSGLKKE